MTSTVTVLGASALISRLARGTILGEVALVAGKQVVATDVADAARARAPVETGRLRDSIVAEADRVTVGAPYGNIVEYGSSNQAPEPYLRPAADTVDGGRTEAAMQAVLGAL